MKALVYTGPKQLEIQDVPRPDGAAIKVEYCGICGSDMHAWAGHDARRPAPLVLGHEIAGVADDGRRVTINPLVTCGKCPACREGRDNLCPDRQILSMPPRPGGFAEYIVAPDDNLIVVPDNVPLAAAALAEPFACGWHAVRLAEKVLFHPIDQIKCLVLGGGAIGIGAALALQAFGATDITLVEPNAMRRARVSHLPGISFTDAPIAAELVIDAVGHAETRATAFAQVYPGGVIAHIGLGSAEGGLDARRATLQEITFFGTYTYTRTDFQETASAIFDGQLPTDGLIDIHDLADGPGLFDKLSKGQIAAAKVLLRP
ncbi:zinc-dependent alcohol dehydrogenase [Parasulfitobacter algicola]|uniref:Alcohol dehydrogenase catalytic domain-containing protein n=1 Tax=Parasulfitobacter algicola TaxID=2614809 RepID=A0ABX2ITB6_9RHOB|nr:alcohol dehydrogenase catalytic domain-containing protein [Sulfitobacter algicola]NSX56157.1 alcohol dehydrogenase catalytic domain-containing protein [Sulfitobacter algicola]